MLRLHHSHIINPRRAVFCLRSLHAAGEGLSSDNPTISYLVTNCGLCASTAEKFNFNLKSPARADAVLALLRSYGFSDSHITSLLSKKPSVLSAKIDTNLRPKLDFFVNLGFSGASLAKMVSGDPDLLKVSLTKRLIINSNLLRTVFSSDEELATAVWRSSRLLRYDLNPMILPNLRSMKMNGFSAPNIIRLAKCYPRVLMRNNDLFNDVIETVKDIGIHASSRESVSAMAALNGLSKSSWDRKLDLFKSFGWSAEDTMRAFKSYPSVVLNSEEKIKKIINFFNEEIGWDTSFLVERPSVLGMSFDRRIVPRCRVMRLLQSKGLKRKSDKNWFLQMSEKNFMERYVTKYADELPDVLEAYEGRMGKKEEELVL